MPRFYNHIKDDPDWVVIRQPIYDKKGNPVWNRFVQTDAEAEELNKDIHETRKKYISLQKERQRLGTISFQQNYLLEAFRR